MCVTHHVEPLAPVWCNERALRDVDQRERPLATDPADLARPHLDVDVEPERTQPDPRRMAERQPRDEHRHSDRHGARHGVDVNEPLVGQNQRAARERRQLLARWPSHGGAPPTSAAATDTTLSASSVLSAARGDQGRPLATRLTWVAALVGGEQRVRW